MEVDFAFKLASGKYAKSHVFVVGKVSPSMSSEGDLHRPGLCLRLGEMVVEFGGFYGDHEALEPAVLVAGPGGTFVKPPEGEIMLNIGRKGSRYRVLTDTEVVAIAKSGPYTLEIF